MSSAMEVFHKLGSKNGEYSPKKKKRIGLIRTSSSEDPDLDEGKLNNMNISSKRQIHSKIEKRRRDKMNDYIAQLSVIIPTHNSNTPKLDKITVLKMAVQYLKSIRTSPIQFNSKENLKYSFINDLELKKLMQQISEGFLFVVGCESARIMYVSKSVSNILKCKPTDMVGRSLYDIIHPYDMDKVKEQISCVDLNPRHQLASIKSSRNLKVDVPSEQLGVHPGNRRSFFFRIKNYVGDSNDNSSTNDSNCPFNGFKNADENNSYTTIQCNGYLKSWNSVNCKPEVIVKSDDTTTVTSFVAVGRTIADRFSKEHTMEPITFVSKHAADGKFLFVENGATIVTGYLPQEILGTNIYDYIHPEDVNDFATTHQSVLQFPSSAIMTNAYRIRSKYGTFVKLQSEWKSLVNPWRNEVEFYYSKNTIVPWDDTVTKFDMEKQKESSCFYEPDLYLPEKQEYNDNIQMDFNFQNINSGKADSVDTSMEAILKLFECDTNIAE